MKDFLIMKRAENSARLGIDCALKLDFFDETSIVSGEIFSVSTVKTKLLAYLKNQNGVTKLSNGDSLKFEKEFSSKDISGGFTAVIVDGETLELILFCHYKNSGFSCEDILKEIKNQTEYDDESISAVNYYEGEKYETKRIYNDDDDGARENKKSPPKNETGYETFLHEELSSKFQNGNFYRAHKDRFDQIIYCHEKDSELCSVIPNGEFVKIPYDEDRFYSVGRVFEKGEVKYLCYAVKGTKNGAPKEISPYYKFLPLSTFDLSVGYFVIFQSAESGKIV